MAEFPGLTLWTDAYLADTRHLSTVEHGAYLLLLMEAWRRPHCDLPDDDKILSRLAGLSVDEWLDIKSAVMAFWKRDGRSQTWSQKRLSLERGKAEVRSTSARGNAAKRWNRTKKPDAPAMPNGCQNDASTATAIGIKEIDPNGSLSSARASGELDFGGENGCQQEAKPKASKRKKPETILSDDWAPVLSEQAQSIVDLWPQGMLEFQIEQFRDHAKTHDRRAADWQAAFRTWVRKADEWRLKDERRNETTGRGFAGDQRGGRGFNTGQGNGFLRRALAAESGEDPREADGYPDREAGGNDLWRDSGPRALPRA